MLNREYIQFNQVDKARDIDKQKEGTQQTLDLLSNLPDELLVAISDNLPIKDTANLASVRRFFHGLFQPEVEKKVAKEAAECAIYPVEFGENNIAIKNVTKLTKLLQECPALLLHPMIVRNRHGMTIKGTVYQIALHEGDNELIDDVIKPAFERLDDGLDKMEKQRQAWLPEGWIEAEEQTCASVLLEIDNVFTAFNNATNPNDITELLQRPITISPNDITELLQRPFTISINKQEVSDALESYRKAIDTLYQRTDKMITNGRDPSCRLLERIIHRYEENYEALGGFTPRNNALVRMVLGYLQRFAPINMMQAFAQGIYYIIKNKEKLNRSFEYRQWEGHFVLPLDVDPLFRLGYEYFGGAGARRVCDWRDVCVKLFVNQKQQLFYNPALCNLGKGIAP